MVRSLLARQTPRRSALILLAALMAFPLSLPIAAADSTSVVATLPEARSGAASVWDAAAGQAYVFGGSDGGYNNQIYRYTPSTNAVTTMSATLPGSGREGACAVWDPATARAYVFGGFTGTSYLNQIARYTPSTNSVTTMSTTLPAGLAFHACFWDGAGNAYLLGGAADGSPTNQILRYTPATGALSTMGATLPTTLHYITAVWDGSGNAYIAGGYVPGGVTNQILRYTPATNTVTVTSATLPTARTEVSMVWAGGGTVYIFGGWSVSPSPTFHNEVLRYTPATNSVTLSDATFASSAGLRQSTAVWDAANSKAYVFGGISSGFTYSSDIVRFSLEGGGGGGSANTAAVSAGKWTTCVLKTDGNADCYGYNAYGQAADYTGGDATAIRTASWHTCALKSNGNVDCYGDNSYGQGADYTGGGATAIRVGERHSCVLKSNGNVDCWGDNSNGQAADYLGGDAVGLGTGWFHTCVLKSNGNVDCYGLNTYGQASDYLGGDAVSVDGGGDHTCVRRSNGNVDCYGRSQYGQGADYLGGDAIGVGAGYGHTCVLKSNKDVDCYGNNADGRATDYSGGDATAVSAGGDHTCIRKESGAVDCFGQNTYGQAEDVAGSASTPTAPQSLTANGGAGQITLNWAAPASSGGSAITNYKVYRGTTPGGETFLDQVGNVLSYPDTGAASGQTYYYKVSAVNSAGEGPQSNEASATLPGVPSAPRALSATAVTYTGGRIDLAWLAPSTTGGSAVTAYRVYRGTTPGGETFLTQVGNVLSFLDTGLANGQAYYYKVSAVNAAGEGAQSNEATATTPSPPDAPLSLQATAVTTAGGRIHLSWVRNGDGGATINSYRVYRGTSSGAEEFLTSDGVYHTWTSVEFEDTGLANGRTYYYKVSAVNGAGEGPLSNEASATTLNVPSPPTSLTAKNVVVTSGTPNTQNELRWTAPSNNGGASIDAYIVYRGTTSDSGTVLAWTGSGQPFIDTTCPEPSMCYYQVSAYNAAGEGGRSNQAWAGVVPDAVRTATNSGAADADPTVCGLGQSYCAYVNGPPGMPNISGPATRRPGESGSYSFSASDPDGDTMTVSIDWGDGSTTTSSLPTTRTHAYASPGDYCLRAKATDVHGTRSPWSNCKGVLVEANKAPAAPAAPSGPMNVDSGVSTAFTAVTGDAEGDTITYTFDWGDGTTSTSPSRASGQSATLSHVWYYGSYCVKARATDSQGAAGLWSPCKTVTMVNIPPKIPVVSGPTNIMSGITTTFGATSEDVDSATVRYEFDWGDGNVFTTGLVAAGNTAFADHAYMGTGQPFCLRVTGIDAEGHRGLSSDCYGVYVTNSPPAKPAIPSGPSAGSVGQSLSYTVSTTDPSGEVIKYYIDWGDGWLEQNIPYQSPGTVTTRSHAWTSTGSFCIRMRALDLYGDYGPWSDCKVVGIGLAPDGVPTACFSHTVTGMTVSANGGCSYDPEGASLSYTWDWGDGTTSTGVTASHTYANRATDDAGMRNSGNGYAVKLTVRDAFQPDTETANVPIGPRDYDLAKHYAPIFYQDTAVSHGKDAKMDEFVKFDFDNDWSGINNWEDRDCDSPTCDRRGFVYFHVTESETDYYIGYAVFHPSDEWDEFTTDPTEHENDMETALVKAHKDATMYGKFLAVLTMAHDAINAYNDPYTYPSSALCDGVRDGADEAAVQMSSYGGGQHPLLGIEHGGHGIFNHKHEDHWYNPEGSIWSPYLNDFNGGDGNIYYPSGTAERPGDGSGGARGNDRDVGYDLLPIDGMWSKRYLTGSGNPFAPGSGDLWGAFHGADGSGSNKAHAPWAIAHTGVVIAGIEWVQPEESRSSGTWFEHPYVQFSYYFGCDPFEDSDDYTYRSVDGLFETYHDHGENPTLYTWSRPGATGASLHFDEIGLLTGDKIKYKGSADTGWAVLSGPLTVGRSGSGFTTGTLHGDEVQVVIEDNGDGQRGFGFYIDGATWS